MQTTKRCGRSQRYKVNQSKPISRHVQSASLQQDATASNSVCVMACLASPAQACAAAGVTCTHLIRKLVPVTERGEAAAEGMAKAIPPAIKRHLRHQLDAKVGETGAYADVPKPVGDEEF